MSEKEPFFSSAETIQAPKLASTPTKKPLEEMDEAQIRMLIEQLKMAHKALKAGRRGSDLIMVTKDLQKLGVYLKLRFKLPDLVYIEEATNKLEKFCPITEVVLPESPPDPNRKTFFSAPQPALLKASEPTNPRGTVEQVREEGAREVTPPPLPAEVLEADDEEIILTEDDDRIVDIEDDPESSEKLRQVLEERNPTPDFEAAKDVVKTLQETGGPEIGAMLGQDELPDEFSGQAINSMLDQEMHQREFQSEMRKGFYESAIQGGGCHIESPETIFDNVDEEEDPWGLRKVEFLGKFNYIDRENRLIYPKNHEKWFDSVHKEGFRERQLWKKFGSEKEIVITLITMDRVHKFISREGQLLDTSYETMEAYYRDPSDEVWSDIKIDLIDPTPPQIIFLESLSNKIAAYAERFAKDDEIAYRAFNNLAQKLKDFMEGEPDWETALRLAESLVQASDLETGDKVHYYREILEEAEAAKIKVDFKFATSVSPRRWVDIDRYHNGTVVRLHNGEVKFNLMNSQGQLIYAEEEAFDYIGQFIGDVARVKRNGKWHFISRENGLLLEEDESQWFAEIYKPRNGMFRVRLTDGRFKFASMSGELIGPGNGFDQAKDFQQNGKASVVFMGDEFEIGLNGERVNLFRKRVAEFVGELLGISTPTSKPKDRLIGGETPLDLPPKAIDQKPYETGDSSDRISGLFSELLQGAGSLKETLELMKLFQGFRKVIQEEKEKKSRPMIVLLRLKNRIQKSGLTASVKERLERFRKKLGYETKMKWVGQPPLSVNFLDYFKGHLTENSDSEKLIVLLRKLETVLICNRILGKVGSGSLLKSLKQVISQSNLDSKAKTRLKTAVTLMFGDPAIQKGMSFEQSFAMKDYHKRLQARRARQQVPVRFTPLQKKANEMALNEELNVLCRTLQQEAEGARKGKLKGLAVDTFRQFQNLVRKNPKHSFDHEKFGTALENLAHAIEKYIEFEPVPESDKSILKINKNEIIKLAIDVFEGVLKRAKSPDAVASIQRHLGICKLAMSMNKEAKNHMEASLAISEDPVLREEFDTLKVSIRSKIRKAWLFRIVGLAAAGYAALWFYEASEPHRVRTRVKECIEMQQPCDDLAEVTERFRALKADDQSDQMLWLKSEMKLGNATRMHQAFTELYSKNKQDISLQLELFSLFKNAEKLGELQQAMNSNDLELETEGAVKVKSFIEILLDLEQAKGIEKKKDRRKALRKVVQNGESLMQKLDAQKSKFPLELYELMGDTHELLGNVKKAKGYRDREIVAQDKKIIGSAAENKTPKKTSKRRR